MACHACADGGHGTWWAARVAKGLRYGFGLAAASAGVQLNLVQRWLGHTDPHHRSRTRQPRRSRFDLQSRFNSPASIPGIGNTSAFALMIEMPEFETLESFQAASLASLVPVTRQSGQWKGKSFISGGKASLRHTLYMPTLVAIRFYADLKAKYQAMIVTGKLPKVAIIAVMRKLVLLANALLKTSRNWIPKQA